MRKTLGAKCASGSLVSPEGILHELPVLVQVPTSELQPGFHWCEKGLACCLETYWRNKR